MTRFCDDILSEFSGHRLCLRIRPPKSGKPTINHSERVGALPAPRPARTKSKPGSRARTPKRFACLFAAEWRSEFSCACETGVRRAGLRPYRVHVEFAPASSPRVASSDSNRVLRGCRRLPSRDWAGRMLAQALAVLCLGGVAGLCRNDNGYRSVHSSAYIRSTLFLTGVYLSRRFFSFPPAEGVSAYKREIWCKISMLFSCVR